VGYDGTPVLRHISLSVDMDDRIALLGANGNGKSTLAKLLADRLAPLAGEMRRGPKLRVGYFAQHQTDELIAAENPIDHMTRALPRASPGQVRSQLARFGLGADRAVTPVANLSGGEKARLLLALATRDAPQLLILDEPTNHLDIDAREFTELNEDSRRVVEKELGETLESVQEAALEADKIAHQMIEPGGAAYEEVVREFGRGILIPDGLVDRQKLGAIVFAEPKRLVRLNAIVHPPVLKEQSRQLAAIEMADPHSIAVVEAALLIEAGFDKKLEYLVVTWCTPEQQLARLTETGKGRGLTIEQARQRIASQMPLEEKRRMADEAIDCSGSLAHTRIAST
jgi:dephospho-CoA kinase